MKKVIYGVISIMLVTVLFLTVFVSFKHSSAVYYCYLKFYYDKMYTQDELLKKSAGLYERKEHAALEDFLAPLITIYPENYGLKKIAAFNYLQLGDSLKGAEIFADIPDHSLEESRNLEEILKNLYYGGNYTDLIYFYDRGVMTGNVNTALYYGVALYKKERYEESYKSLIYARGNTFMLPELHFYLGLNLEKKGRQSEALEYIKNAYEYDRHNKLYKKGLIDIYRKSGLYREAEILLRSR